MDYAGDRSTEDLAQSSFGSLGEAWNGSNWSNWLRRVGNVVAKDVGSGNSSPSTKLLEHERLKGAVVVVVVVKALCPSTSTYEQMVVAVCLFSACRVMQ